MFDKNNTAIIFGTSPFITEFGSDNINYLINKYTTVGINTFGMNYPNIEYWIWSDYGAYEVYRNYLNESHKVLVSSDVYEKEILPHYSHDINIEYTYNGSGINISHDLDNINLLMFKTTAHPAINYMYLKGYKNIILCGVDLTSNWNHFDGINNDIIRSCKRIERIRERLYMFKDYINLYTLNSNSDLDIDKINIKEL